jgi:hypothetical protein
MYVECLTVGNELGGFGQKNDVDGNTVTNPLVGVARGEDFDNAGL